MSNRTEEARWSSLSTILNRCCDTREETACKIADAVKVTPRDCCKEPKNVLATVSSVSMLEVTCVYVCEYSARLTAASTLSLPRRSLKIVAPNVRAVSKLACEMLSDPSNRIKTSKKSH